MGYQVEVFYDADCPLCVREIRMLQWMDRRRQNIRFTDISAADFDAAEHGKTHDDFMAEIHGRLADGSWIIGVEVFRQLYAAIGFGPVIWISRLPGIRGLLEWSYRLFARNRLRLTGRCAGKSCEVPIAPQPAENSDSQVPASAKVATAVEK